LLSGTFIPVANAVWGYNQVSALVDATLDSEVFAALPDICVSGLKRSFKVDFVSTVSGRICEIRHLDTMRALPSFLRFDLMPSIGSNLVVTVDCFSACGSVSLVNDDKAQLELDVLKVRDLEKTMWIIQPEEAEEAGKN
jgi:hypothetical protein